MSLANGRPYLAIPGPSVVPDTVLSAMHRASPNIYEGEIVDLMPGILKSLTQLAGTAGKAAVYIGNGHAAWEAALVNLLAPGDRAVCLANGLFGNGWGMIAAGIGAELTMIDSGPHAPLDLDALTRTLEEDKDHAIRTVLTAQVDTSSGYRNDVTAVRAALDAAGHPALLLVDCIASLGCDRYEMDAMGADLTVAGSQKGLMCPPGLGFVFIGPKAEAARAARKSGVSPYWDWQPRIAPEAFYQHFGGTAPTQALFGLRAALDLMENEGLTNVWARHEALAQAIWAACKVWGMRFNVTNPDHRSRAVTALAMDAPDATRLRRWCEHQAGVTLGIGLGMATEADPNGDGFFRIGHMGHVNAHMVLGMLGAVEAGLTALKIPHGRGALDAAADVIAESCGGD